MPIGPYDEPTKVTPVDGEVTLDGPDGIAVSMTPEAAEETAERLIEAAGRARAQRILKKGVPAGKA
jgi:hypothetical protein